MRYLIILASGIILTLSSSPPGAAQGVTGQESRLDSYAYYGLGASHYTPEQRRGRDTWIFWTGGNEKFFRLGTRLGGRIGVSIEYYRLLDSRDRETRFERLGLIDEPNCRAATGPDQYGLWFDEWRSDPYGVNRPGAPEDPKAYPDVTVFGEPTGVIGLRKFRNPAFDPGAWGRNGGAEGYFRAPDRVEPPYLIGMTCAFCHMGFHPQRPPADPVNPRWDNLAANLGNQYLHEGRIFFGSGKIVYGDQNNGRGLGDEDFLHHLGETQERGTSETSRLSYDFINNPNVINSIFYLHSRPSFRETLNGPVVVELRKITRPGDPLPAVHHILKDGADSQGIPAASIRVYVNIGMYGEYWVTRLWNPLRPKDPQRPFEIEVAARNSRDWQDTLRRMPDLEAYLATYTPMRLEEIQEAVDKGYVIPDSFKDSDDPQKRARWRIVERGRAVFADQCARCHSSKQPDDTIRRDPERVRAFFRAEVMKDDFLRDNALTDDVRYPVSELRTNAARALATNAIRGHIWEDFSSPEYKDLPAAGPLTLYNPPDPSHLLTWQPPAGGRGYYRTASLVNIWATAPFLHNNSVGAFPGDLGLPAEEWPTVDSRLRAFDDAIEKLLNPQRRAGLATIKRVQRGDTNLYLRLQQLLERLPEVQAIEGLAGRVDQFLQRIDLLNLRGHLPEAPHMEVALRFPVPAGTPINLLANIHVNNAAGAALQFVRYKLARKLGDRRGADRALDALLHLSECPDLVEDHGHEYGSELSQDDKQALIEYLKKM